MLKLTPFWALLAAAAAFTSLATEAQAQGYNGPSSTPQVFYNYYSPAVPYGTQGGVGAQLYVSPVPVPEHVGHTYNPYPPLNPHEFMYGHSKTYVRNHGPHGGITVTDVHYGTRPLKIWNWSKRGHQTIFPGTPTGW